MSELVQEALELSDFEKWLNDRTFWLQTAAKKLIDNKRLPNNDEIVELVRLCKLEAAKQNAPEFQKVAPGSFSAGLYRDLFESKSCLKSSVLTRLNLELLYLLGKAT